MNMLRNTSIHRKKVGQTKIGFLRTTEYFVIPSKKKNYNFAFIPYEILLVNYRKVSDIISKLLDLETHYTYNNFKHFFKKQKDLSTDIVKDGLIVHKRNTNIYEYREKISEDIISKFQKAFPITKVFDDYIENEKCVINLNENRNNN